MDETIHLLGYRSEIRPIQIGVPWMPILIRIRQNDADLIGSESTTLATADDL
jgi:hypothetical protein